MADDASWSQDRGGEDWLRFRMMCGFADRAMGLLHDRASLLDDGGVALLTPCSSIHTFGMAYPIDVAFIDSSGRVTRSIRSLPPRRLVTCRGSAAVLERPTRDDVWWREGDVVEIVPPGDSGGTGREVTRR